MIDLPVRGHGVTIGIDIHQISEERYTAFCEVCRRQVFGEDPAELVEDMDAHMEESH